MKRLVLVFVVMFIALAAFSVQPVQAQGTVIYIPMVGPRSLQIVEGGPVFGELNANLVVNAGTTSYCPYPWTPVAAEAQQVCLVSGTYVGPLTAQDAFGIPVFQNGGIQLWGGTGDGVNAIGPDEYPMVEFLVTGPADDFEFPDGPVADLVVLGGNTVPFIDAAFLTQPNPVPIIRYADAMRKFIAAFVEEHKILPGIPISSYLTFYNYKMTGGRPTKIPNSPASCTEAETVQVLFTGGFSTAAGGSIALAEVQFSNPAIHYCMTRVTSLHWYIYFPVGLLIEQEEWINQFDSQVRGYLAVENTYSIIPRWLGELPSIPDGTEWVITAIAGAKFVHYLIGFYNAAEAAFTPVSGFFIVVPNEFLCGIQHGLPEGACWQNPPPQSVQNN